MRELGDVNKRQPLYTQDLALGGLAWTGQGRAVLVVVAAVVVVVVVVVIVVAVVEVPASAGVATIGAVPWVQTWNIPSVAYTHMTLPKNREAQIEVCHIALKKK